MSNRAKKILTELISIYESTGKSEFDPSAFMNDGLALQELVSHDCIEIVNVGIIEKLILHPNESYQMLQA